VSISPAETTSESQTTNRLFKRWLLFASQREEQVFLALTLLIGALVGLAVVAFIVLTERLGMRLYPVGSEAWRRVLIPIAGSLAMAISWPAIFQMLAAAVCRRQKQPCLRAMDISLSAP